MEGNTTNYKDHNNGITQAFIVDLKLTYGVVMNL